jgi:hypothetical protein
VLSAIDQRLKGAAEFDRDQFRSHSDRSLPETVATGPGPDVAVEPAVQVANEVVGEDVVEG